MGISLECNDIEFDCSYTIWNRIRLSIAKSFTKYLHEEVTKFIGYEDNKYMFRPLDAGYDMSNLFEDYPESVTIDDYLERMKDYSIRNALICIGISGIYTLLEKSDCDGFYSPGNSLDIVGLLKNIEEYIDKDLVPYDKLLHIFTSGYESKKGVTIL
jgi:uncharacterized protein YeeX (DUF496 family)